MSSFQPFLIALQFLTRFPVSTKNVTDEEIGESLLFYPLIGLIIGLLLFVLASIMNETSPLLSSAIILAVWVFITGGLHIDGLADSADAWIGGNGDRHRSLEIMKDPRSGPIAITVVVLVLLLKFAAIQVIVESDQIALLLIAPVIGRLFMPVLFMTTTYVRKNGLGSSMTAHLPKQKKCVITIAFGLLFILLFGAVGLMSIIACSLLFLLLRRFMIKILGGMTGDTAGATLEIIEVTALVTLAMSLPI